MGKGSQTITFTSTNTSATVDGAAYTPTFTHGNSINSVQLNIASVSATICELNSGAISFHAVGDCVIEANQAGDNNYDAATTATHTVSVAMGEQLTIVGHSSVTSLTLGTNTPTAVLTTTGGSGSGSVTWTVNSGSDAYCSVSGDVVSGLASGYCRLTATKAADANYHETSTSLTLMVSTGGQTPVLTSVSNDTPTYSPGLTLTLSLAGGDGEGAVWYESSTTHVCNVTGGSTLAIYHAGNCTVIGHKDGDDNFEAVQNELTFAIAKAAQSGASIHLANDLVYSAEGSVSAELSLVDGQSDGAHTFSVTRGTCTIIDGSLTATQAGDCEVTAALTGDDRYLDGSVSHTFTVGKAAQTQLSLTLTDNATESVAWNGINHTSFTVTGGSGTASRTVATTTPAICSVSIENAVITVTGLTQGTCEASVSNATSTNYLAATTLFSVEVLDLAGAPSAVTASTPVRGQGGIKTSNLSWTAPEVSATRAAVTGYKVQWKIGAADWADIPDITADATTTSVAVTVAPWTKYNFRVAATSALDGETLAWEYFDLANDDVPDVLAVNGGDVLLSTTKAATTSGETVYVDGSGFVEGYTTRVQLTAASGIFTAGLRPAAALTTTKVVTATYVSPTRLSFTLPKITLPKGVLSLTTQIKVLSTDGLVSEPIPLDYIPKKLAQTLTAVLPATALPINVGSTLQSAGTILSSSLDNPPVVTASPAEVCTAVINSDKKLVITPVSPGKCSISVVVPGTPAYLPSAAKAAVYTIKSTRTAGLTLTANDVQANGVLGSAHTFTALNTLLTPGELNVVLGENPIDLPVALSAREGTLLFTVLPADETAGRCTADGGDATNGLFGSISILDLGDCHITVSQPADAGWYAGETINLVIHATEQVTPPQVDVPVGAVLSEEDTDLNPLDLDTEPAIAIAIDPNAAANYSFGGEDGVGYDPVAGKFIIRSTSALVGTWTVTLTSPSVAKKWFKIPGKIVKKVQTYTFSNVCALTLTVKKDPKLKKRVTRIIGAGCLLSSSTDRIGTAPIVDNGKSALTAVGIQKIKIKFKRTRQYAKTGLDYQGTAKAKKRILKKINRTIVLRVGRAN